MSKRRLAPTIVLFLAPLLLFATLLLSGKALFWGTPSTQFIPWWTFAWRSLIQGQLPLWNPMVGMGAPLLANYQSGLFYPPYWIYFLVYAAGGASWMAWSVTLIVCAHLIWSGLGTAKLLKELQVGELGQAIGGLSFSLSGYLVARAGFLSINAAVSWLPWILVSVFRMANQNKRSFLALTVSISMLLLAGHAQTAWYSLILAGIWMIFWSFRVRDSAQLKSLGQGLLKYLASGILAAGICAVQLLPTVEYLLNSQRAAEYGYAQAMTYSFWPWRFLTLVVPNLYGNPALGNYWGYGSFWEDAVYIGLMPIGLAVGFLFKNIFSRRQNSSHGRRSHARPTILLLGSITVVSFILALGDNTPIFPFLYRFVPTFDLFQAPARWTIWAVISLSLLAGMGADSLSKPSGKRLYVTRLAAAACLAVVAGSALSWYGIKGIKPTFLLPTAAAGVIGFSSVLLVLNKPADPKSDRYCAWAWLVTLLVCVDLIAAGWGLNPGIKRELYREDPRPVSLTDGRVWIPADDEYQLKFDRFFLFDSFYPAVDWKEMFDLPLPNLGILEGVEMVNNFDPMVSGQYQLWMSEVEGESPSSGLLSLMDVKKVVQISDGDILVTIPNTQADSRLRVAGCRDVVESASRALELVLDDPEDSYQNIILTAQRTLPCGPDVDGSADIEITRNGYLLVDTYLERNGWLFWSQSWYPGWIAKVDGVQIAGPLPANYLFQAVPVPAGRHQVEFIYRPASFIWGGVVSVLSLAFWGALAVLMKGDSDDLKTRSLREPDL